jgi:hypothetical protein
MTSASFPNPDVHLTNACARTKQEEEEEKMKWQMHKLRCIIALCMHVISELQYPINHIAGYH